MKATLNYERSLVYARQLDKSDPLATFQKQFYQPLNATAKGVDPIYFCGNSLGLQPKRTQDLVNQAMQDWRDLAVTAWHNDSVGWLRIHELISEKAAPIVGAKPSEVVIMNTLTVNLHLLMVSFYRPTANRFKIVMEAGAFSSDQYAIESQVRFHGFVPSEAIIEIAPREGEHTLRHEDIVQTLETHAKTVALVLFGGVNYYTGQFFDIENITRKGQEIGAVVGFDLAHAAGNVPLRLHEWGVDFAVWCTYKYLNSGPGGVGGAFIHERHHATTGTPRFAGWWGYDLNKRFEMQSGFVPMAGAAGWQVSTAQILPFVAHLSSLSLIAEAGGIEALRQKSVNLTGFFIFLLQSLPNYGKKFWLLTPSEAEQRGAQLSIYVPSGGKAFFRHLTEGGIIGDWREPNVIRLAPVPLYNTYEEVFFVSTFFELL